MLSKYWSVSLTHFINKLANNTKICYIVRKPVIEKISSESRILSGNEFFEQEPTSNKTDLLTQRLNRPTRKTNYSKHLDLNQIEYFPYTHVNKFIKLSMNCSHGQNIVLLTKNKLNSYFLKCVFLTFKLNNYVNNSE